jgi:hypothetical protein
MKPTLEEYNKAKSNKAFAQNALRHCRRRMGVGVLRLVL